MLRQNHRRGLEASGVCFLSYLKSFQETGLEHAALPAHPDTITVNPVRKQPVYASCPFNPTISNDSFHSLSSASWS